MTTPTPKQMNEAQVAEYSKWLDEEIKDYKDSRPYSHADNGRIIGIKDARVKFRSLLSSSSTTGDEWVSILRAQPYFETEVDVLFKDGSTGRLMYWNDVEGFDAQTEPHGLMVTHFKLPPKTKFKKK